MVTLQNLMEPRGQGDTVGPQGTEESIVTEREDAFTDNSMTEAMGVSIFEMGLNVSINFKRIY